MFTDGSLSLSDGFPVLTVAHVVCREGLEKCNVGSLPYVVRQVNGYLDTKSGPGAMALACKRGLSVHLLSYIASRDTTSCWKESAVSAAEGGHVHVLQWLTDNCADRCQWGAKIMDTAARYGHLRAVQWLHNNRNEGCTTDAMDWAMHRGDVVMAQWLQANRTEGCTDFSMNYAAFGGHLEMLQWMSLNRREGRPGLALRAAAQNGHLAVVQWLYSRSDDRYRRLALEDANKFGQTDVAEWLQCEQRKENGLHECITNAVEWISHMLVSVPATIKGEDKSAKHEA